MQVTALLWACPRLKSTFSKLTPDLIFWNTQSSEKQYSKELGQRETREQGDYSAEIIHNTQLEFAGNMVTLDVPTHVCNLWETRAGRHSGLGKQRASELVIYIYIEGAIN